MVGTLVELDIAYCSFYYGTFVCARVCMPKCIYMYVCVIAHGHMFQVTTSYQFTFTMSRYFWILDVLASMSCIQVTRFQGHPIIILSIVPRGWKWPSTTLMIEPLLQPGFLHEADMAFSIYGWGRGIVVSLYFCVLCVCVGVVIGCCCSSFFSVGAFGWFARTSFFYFYFCVLVFGFC